MPCQRQPKPQWCNAGTRGCHQLNRQHYKWSPLPHQQQRYGQERLAQFGHPARQQQHTGQQHCCLLTPVQRHWPNPGPSSRVYGWHRKHCSKEHLPQRQHQQHALCHEWTQDATSAAAAAAAIPAAAKDGGTVPSRPAPYDRPSLWLLPAPDAAFTCKRWLWSCCWSARQAPHCGRVQTLRSARVKAPTPASQQHPSARPAAGMGQQPGADVREGAGLWWQGRWVQTAGWPFLTCVCMTGVCLVCW
jgi:hypothetical protein